MKAPLSITVDGATWTATRGKASVTVIDPAIRMAPVALLEAALESRAFAAQVMASASKREPSWKQQQASRLNGRRHRARK